MIDEISIPRYIDRRRSGCTKWDNLPVKFKRQDLLPMWIADMDFASPQCVTDALTELASSGVYGYNFPPDDYFTAFINWQKEQHGLELQREWLFFAPGLVPALNWCIQIYSQPNAGVVLLTPVYYPMLDAVRNNGRRLLACDLHNENGRYTIDFTALEDIFRREKPQLLILCSPHNPCGRVWTKEELSHLLSLCRRYQVLVIADEIHQDLTMPGHRQIPAATVGDYQDMLIFMTAPSKTFNLAGLQNSVVCIPDSELREKFERFTTGIRITYGNSFGYVAARAAWTGGLPWLEAVRKHIWENYLYFRDKLTAAFPRLTVSPLEGTYLVWVDFSAYVQPAQLEEFMLERCRIAVDFGHWFGKAGAGHARFNVATSRENIEEAAGRIIAALSGLNG